MHPRTGEVVPPLLADHPPFLLPPSSVALIKGKKGFLRHMSGAAVIGAVVAAIAPMVHSRWMHRETLNTQQRQLKEKLDLERAVFETTVKNATSRYSEESTLSLQQFAESMSVDLDLTRRETLRDVWIQRHLMNQTMLEMGAFLLACSFENFTQSTLPFEDSNGVFPVWLLYAQNFCLGLAVVCCTCAILACLKVQGRLGWYALGDPTVVYDCGRAHSNFNDYYDCHCRWLRTVGSLCFYVAGAMVMIAAVFLQAIKYVGKYQNDVVAPILLAVPIGVGLIVMTGASLRQQDSKAIHHHQPSTEVDFGGLHGAIEEEGAVVRETEVGSTLQ